MAIVRTPTAITPQVLVVDEKEIEALINKGGSSTQVREIEVAEDEDAIKTVLVRTYASLLHEIDQLILQIPKRNRPSRNAYIVEAIKEKMRRDKNKRK